MRVALLIVVAGFLACNAVQAGATTQVDIFGRPYIGWDPLQYYCYSAPYDPLPQFWKKSCAQVHQASSFGDDHYGQATPGPAR